MGIDAISRAPYTSIPQTTNQSDNLGKTTETKEINISDVVAPAKMKTTKSGTESNFGEKNPQASEKQIRDTIAKVNQQLMNRTRCEFSYHEETKRVSIKVIDEDTKEVIKEIPPEETLDMVQRVWELAGLLVDERR